MNVRVGSIAASPSSLDNTAETGQSTLLNYDISVTEKPQLGSLQVEHSVVSTPAVKHSRIREALSPGLRGRIVKLTAPLSSVEVTKEWICTSTPPGVRRHVCTG
jgi:hypothetical protein